MAYLLYSGAAFASGNLQLSITPKNNNLEVKIFNAEQSNYEIEITNAKGDIIYYKITKRSGVACNYRYDYSALGDGKYTYQVKLGEETVTAYVKIKNAKAEIIDQ